MIPSSPPRPGPCPHPPAHPGAKSEQLPASLPTASAPEAPRGRPTPHENEAGLVTLLRRDAGGAGRGGAGRGRQGTPRTALGGCQEGQLGEAWRGQCYRVRCGSRPTEVGIGLFFYFIIFFLSIRPVNFFFFPCCLPTSAPSFIPYTPPRIDSSLLQSEESVQRGVKKSDKDDSKFVAERNELQNGDFSSNWVHNVILYRQLHDYV